MNSMAAAVRRQWIVLVALGVLMACGSTRWTREVSGAGSSGSTLAAQLASTGALSGGPSVAASGTWVYVLDRGGIAVVDASNPTRPMATGAITASLSLSALVVVGQTLVAGGQDRLLLYDLMDARSPRLVGEHPLQPHEGDTFGGLIELSKGADARVWACLWSVTTEALGSSPIRTECQAIDLTDPTQPRQVGAFGDTSISRHQVTGLTAGAEFGVEFDRESVLGGSIDTITAFDVRQPDKVVELGRWSVGIGSFGHAQVIGHWLYVDSFFYFEDFRPPDGFVGRLRVFDLLALADGPVAQFRDSTVVAPMAVDDVAAYSVADRLTVLDVSRPDQPEARGWLAVPGAAQGLAVHGRQAYLVAQAGWRRVYVIDTGDPWHPALIGMVELAPRPESWRRVFLPAVGRLALR